MGSAAAIVGPMSSPLRTPYDGSSKLFQIGLKPLDAEKWIDVDDRLAADLAQKERLAAERWDEVFAAEPGTEAAQSELLAMLVEYLPAYHSQTHRHVGDAMFVAGRSIALDGQLPLWTAARLVQEDLVLMRRGADGWRLAAASLSFPSSWRLRDKIGRPIHEVHGPVPGFGGGTRNADLIQRMFDNLRPDTGMVRWNWSLYGDDALHHPHDSPPRRFGGDAKAAHVFLRVERQTLRRLPVSGDIVFAIRIAVDPLAALEAHTDSAGIAAAIISQLQALSPEQLAYKGITDERDGLIARLTELTVQR
jgi:hypothetical protein